MTDTKSFAFWNEPEDEARNAPLPVFDAETITTEQGAELWADFLEKYADDWASLASEIFADELMPHQVKVLEAINRGTRRIALKSGHRVGKTRLLAIIAICHLITRYPQKTIITAPTSGQLFNSLYAEILTLARRLPPFLKGLFTFMSEEIRLKADPDGSFLAARTASPDNPESFQGIHSENVLFIWDEASGIDERLFNAARGSMAAPNAISIMAGNPVRLNNTFHRAFTVNADLYFRVTISSLGLKTVDPDFIKEVAQSFGEDSNEYRVRVLGEFPDTEDESYISAATVRAARRRQIDPSPLAAVVYGVDPARHGDDRTVITRRRGMHVIEMQKELRKKDTMETVGEIVQMATEDHNRLVEEFKRVGRSLLTLPPVPAAVVVDVIGIGAGVADRLRELDYNVIEVNAAETSTDEPRCERVRDALWKKFRDYLWEGKCRIPDNDVLEAELSGAHYTYNSTGTLKMESKKDMKKRIGRSPDLADSAMLTLYAPADLFLNFLKTGQQGNIGYGSGPRGALSRGSGAPTARR